MGMASHLECPKCSQTYDYDQLINTCKCGSPLLVKYDLAKLKTLKKDILIGRRADLWRYWEFLPLKKPENIVTLGEGYTPIFKAENLGEKLGFDFLYIKDFRIDLPLNSDAFTFGVSHHPSPLWGAGMDS